MKRTILIICMLAAGVAAAADTSVNRSIALSRTEGVLLVVSLPAGSIRLVAQHSGPVSVSGTLLDGATLKLASSSEGGVIELAVSRADGRTAEARLEVRYPGWVDVRVQGFRSGITLEGGPTPSNLDLSTVDGEIVVTGARGSVQARTFSGAISIEAQALSVDARSTTGKVRITGNTARVDAQTMSGPIELDDATFANVDLRSVSGAVTARLQWAYSDWVSAFRASSETGSVSLEVPKSIMASFKLSLTGVIEGDANALDDAVSGRLLIEPAFVDRSSTVTVTATASGYFDGSSTSTPKVISTTGYTETFTTGSDRTQIALSTRDGKLTLTFR